ncbi:MAG: hypothetical protein CBC35_05575 [Planctomycetes bacterium TMED75]|nr:hypothetical protein [Planctomycetaceae bacterium]OUU93400.1 MAG: hypothetical protein CBC35_05575 [Planctomycetes bacterium TMED75]
MPVPSNDSEATASDASGIVSLPNGVVCDRTRNQVILTGEVAIDAGFLEQVVCIPGTREHEALVVVDARPADVHAALLLLGARPGRPGRWEYGETDVLRLPPEGDRVSVRVRFVDNSGAPQEHLISSWIVGQPGDRPFPEQPWVFGGSRFDDQGRYLADSSGSLIGLVTFGDEVLGLESVLADSIEVDSAVWEARTLVVPRPGTPVQLILSPWSPPFPKE